MGSGVIAEIDKEPNRNGESARCAVAERMADQQEIHAIVPPMVERQWLRML
jgi:hypothetical protein